MIGGRNRPIVIALVASALGLFAVLVLLGSGPYPAWLAGWSVVTFAAYAIDKAQARRGGWRIPEVVLHGLAIAGGALGGLIGFVGLHHKTRHPIFALVLIVALTVQIAIGVAIGW